MFLKNLIESVWALVVDHVTCVGYLFQGALEDRLDVVAIGRWDEEVFRTDDDKNG